MKRAVGEVGLRALRGYFRRRAHPNLVLVGVELISSRTATGQQVTARYHVRRHGNLDLSPIYFDLFASRLAITAIRSTIVSFPNVSSDNVGFFIPLIPSTSDWEEGTIEIDFMWADDHLECLLIPGSFPMPLISHKATPAGSARPWIRIKRGSDPGVWISGVRSHDEPDAFISAVIGWTERFVRHAADDGSNLILSRRIDQDITPAQGIRAANLTARILSFLASEFGVNPNATVCAKSFQDRASFEMLPHGSCFDAVAATFGLNTESGVPSDISLAEQLAGVWWGGGCQLVGRNALELECAITSAFADRWLACMEGGDFRDQVQAVYEEQTRLGRAAGWISHARGRVNARKTMKWTNDLYMLLAKDPTALVYIQTFLARYWGKLAPATEVQMTFGLR